MEMTKYKLADLCVSITDGEHGSVKDDSGSTYFLLNNNNITESGIVINSKDRRISKKDFEKIHKRTNLECGDLVIATCGTLGKTCVIKDSLINYEFSRSVGIIKCNRKKLLPEYLHYFFLNPLVQSRIVGNAKGGVQKHFYIGDMKDFEIQIPILAEQKKIASVLSALDDKIALNKKMNQKLEAMAKRLYDYWFVQYDFPDKNGHPYKTTGGPMTYNPTLKREIPVGWEVKQICDIAKIFNGSTPSTTEEENYGGEIVWITPKDLSDQNCKFVYQGARNITQAGYDSCSTTMVPKGTVVMSSRAPIGLLSIAQCDLCTNQGFKNMVPNDMTDSKYLYYTIQQHIPQIQNLGTGTTFKEVSKDELGRFAILYPPKKLIATFEEKVAPIFDVQFNKVKEISRLTALRDKLLPLLMNGQVVVG